MIEHDVVQRIIDTAEIIDVVQDFVTLKKRGVNFLGLCPFHDEKTPSFTVSPSKGIFKCFGCGKAGNAVGFVMEHEKMSYPEALKYIAKKYHIEIIEKEQTQDEIREKKDRESLHIITSFAQKYFTETLFNHKEGIAVGLSYFKERKFSEDIISKFQLGYCLEKKDAFTQEALNHGYKLDFLKNTGLTIVKDNFKFDRFYGRIIFPILSISGRVIAFGGRTLKQSAKEAKYINSPESEIYSKSRNLYGLFYAKKSIIKNEKCYLVEGYTDVISFHQSGIENVVASSGTSLTVDQIRLVKRFTNNLTIIYDGDPAGIKASLRGIDLILEEGMNVKVILLPEGEDPDSFSKSMSSEDFNSYITENEKNFISFKLQLLVDEVKDDPVKKSGLITDIVRSIAIIPDKILQSVYIRDCSKILNISEEILYGETNKIIYKKLEVKRRRNKSELVRKSRIKSTPLPSFIEGIFSEVEEKEIIYFLLNFGDKVLYSEKDNPEEEFVSITVAEFIINEIQNDNLEFENLIYKRIFEDYRDKIDEEDFLPEKYFINHPDNKINSLAVNLLSPDYLPSEFWLKAGSPVRTPDMTFQKDVPKAILAYKLKIIRIAIEDTDKKIKELPTNILDQIQGLLEQKIRLDGVKVQLAKESGERIIF